MVAVDAWFTTASTPLHVNTSPYGIKLGSIDEVKVSYQRDWVKSPYIDGAFLVSAVADIVKQPITIWVFGTSHSNLQTSVATLIAAVSQFSYEFHLSLDSTVWAWDCNIADYSVGFTFQMSNKFVAPVAIELFRQPTPHTGPF